MESLTKKLNGNLMQTKINHIKKTETEGRGWVTKELQRDL